MDVVLDVAWRIAASPDWLGYGLGWSLITGGLCTVSFLVGNDRIGGDR
jgi:hypothetical protein